MAKRSIRAYVELATGLGEVTRARALEAAQEILSLAGSPGAVAGQVERLAGELLAAAEQNRDHVVTLVRREVDAAVARVDSEPGRSPSCRPWAPPWPGWPPASTR